MPNRWLAAVRLLIGTLSIALPAASAAQTPILVSPSDPRQAFEGWGTSLCWWAHDLGTWRDESLDALTTLVADTSRGLGMTIFRYNIGGGDRPGHAHMRADADVPGWKLTEAGTYDWSADAGQRRSMAFLRRKARNPIWEAFANSPPWWMTKSGCVSGNTDGSNNLKEDYYDDFAEYLVSVARRLQETDSVVFRTLAPFNEPNSDWWRADGRQEGCMFSRATQPRLIQEVGRRLRSAGLSGTTVSAADANSIGEMLGNAQSYDSLTLSFVSQFNTHSYFGSVAERRSLWEISRRLGKKLWQSETGPLSWPGGNQFDAAMWSAELILRDLREMRAEAWIDWQVAGGGVWGVIDYTRSNQTARMNKKGSAYAQFSRFIRPGAVILGSGNDNTLAAWHPGTGALVLVAVNPAAAATAFPFNLSAFQALPSVAQAFRTSADEDLARLADLPVADRQVTVQAPPRSVTTVVLRNAVTSALAREAGYRARNPAWRTLRSGTGIRIRDAAGELGIDAAGRLSRLPWRGRLEGGGW